MAARRDQLKGSDRGAYVVNIRTASGASNAGSAPLQNTFAHYTVFYSIIIGLTVARVLAGAAELINRRRTVQFHAPFLLWAFFVLLAAAYEWWLILRWQDVEAVNFFRFAFVSIRPAILYLVAHILLPDFTQKETLDLKPHFYRAQGWIFALIALLYPIGIIDTALKGSAYFAVLFPRQLPYAFAGLAIALVAARTRNDRLQSLLALLMVTRLVLTVLFV